MPTPIIKQPSNIPKTKIIQTVNKGFTYVANTLQIKVKRMIGGLKQEKLKYNNTNDGAATLVRKGIDKDISEIKQISQQIDQLRKQYKTAKTSKERETILNKINKLTIKISQYEKFKIPQMKAIRRRWYNSVMAYRIIIKKELTLILHLKNVPPGLKGIVKEELKTLQQKHKTDSINLNKLYDYGKHLNMNEMFVDSKDESKTAFNPKYIIIPSKANPNKNKQFPLFQELIFKGPFHTSLLTRNIKNPKQIKNGEDYVDLFRINLKQLNHAADKYLAIKATWATLLYGRMTKNKQLVIMALNVLEDGARSLDKLAKVLIKTKSGGVFTLPENEQARKLAESITGKKFNLSANDKQVYYEIQEAKKELLVAIRLIKGVLNESGFNKSNRLGGRTALDIRNLYNLFSAYKKPYNIFGKYVGETREELNLNGFWDKWVYWTSTKYHVATVSAVALGALATFFIGGITVAGATVASPALVNALGLISTLYFTSSGAIEYEVGKITHNKKQEAMGLFMAALPFASFASMLSERLAPTLIKSENGIVRVMGYGVSGIKYGLDVVRYAGEAAFAGQAIADIANVMSNTGNKSSFDQIFAVLNSAFILLTSLKEGVEAVQERKRVKSLNEGESRAIIPQRTKQTEIIPEETTEPKIEPIPQRINESKEKSINKGIQNKVEYKNKPAEEQLIKEKPEEKPTEQTKEPVEKVLAEETSESVKQESRSIKPKTKIIRDKKKYEHSEVTNIKNAKVGDFISFVSTDLKKMGPTNRRFGRYAGDEIVNGYANYIRTKLSPLLFYHGEESYSLIPKNVTENDLLGLKNISVKFNDAGETRSLSARDKIGGMRAVAINGKKVENGVVFDCCPETVYTPKNAVKFMQDTADIAHNLQKISGIVKGMSDAEISNLTSRQIESKFGIRVNDLNGFKSFLKDVKDDNHIDNFMIIDKGTYNLIKRLSEFVETKDINEIIDTSKLPESNEIKSRAGFNPNFLTPESAEKPADEIYTGPSTTIRITADLIGGILLGKRTMKILNTLYGMKGGNAFIQLVLDSTERALNALGIKGYVVYKDGFDPVIVIRGVKDKSVITDLKNLVQKYMNERLKNGIKSKITISVFKSNGPTSFNHARSLVSYTLDLAKQESQQHPEGVVYTSDDFSLQRYVDLLIRRRKGAERQMGIKSKWTEQNYEAWAKSVLGIPLKDHYYELRSYENEKGKTEHVLCYNCNEPGAISYVIESHGGTSASSIALDAVMHGTIDLTKPHRFVIKTKLDFDSAFASWILTHPNEVIILEGSLKGKALLEELTNTAKDTAYNIKIEDGARKIRRDLAIEFFHGQRNGKSPSLKESMNFVNEIVKSNGNFESVARKFIISEKGSSFIQRTNQSIENITYNSLSMDGKHILLIINHSKEPMGPVNERLIEENGIRKTNIVPAYFIHVIPKSDGSTLMRFSPYASQSISESSANLIPEHFVKWMNSTCGSRCTIELLPQGKGIEIKSTMKSDAATKLFLSKLNDYHKIANYLQNHWIISVVDEDGSKFIESSVKNQIHKLREFLITYPNKLNDLLMLLDHIPWIKTDDVIPSAKEFLTRLGISKNVNPDLKYNIRYLILNEESDSLFEFLGINPKHILDVSFERTVVEGDAGAIRISFKVKKSNGETMQKPVILSTSNREGKPSMRFKNLSIYAIIPK